MEAIIASVLGGLVSGLFAFLGVWLTIRHENKKAPKPNIASARLRANTYSTAEQRRTSTAYTT
ncbi:MAG: hypothetical protein J6L85_07990 [Clostridia bacterium]|nr:hypothetical protein [Clostridia bacterium]